MCKSTLLIFQRERNRPFSVATKETAQVTKIPGVRGDEGEDAERDIEARVSLVDTEFDKTSFQFVANYEQLLSTTASVSSMQLVGPPGSQIILVAYSDGNVTAYVAGGRFARQATAQDDGDEPPPSAHADAEAKAQEGETEKAAVAFRKKSKVHRDRLNDITEPPPMVLSFQAHSPLSPSPFRAVQLSLCPWSSLPGSVYSVEFFSIGNDYKLVHWGIRCKNDSQEVDLLRNAFEVDVLGVSWCACWFYFPLTFL